MAAGRRRALGALGEEAAARWYARHGYRVLSRNWRCRDGELDLVVEGRGVLVFCEVKARSGTGFGAPAEAVDDRKQRRLRRLAAAWLSEASGGRRRRSRSMRFDVASVLWRPGEEPVVDVLEAAF